MMMYHVQIARDIMNCRSICFSQACSNSALQHIRLSRLCSGTDSDKFDERLPARHFNFYDTNLLHMGLALFSQLVSSIQLYVSLRPLVAHCAA
jgi:hypothetical protein